MVSVMGYNTDTDTTIDMNDAPIPVGTTVSFTLGAHEWDSVKTGQIRYLTDGVRVRVTSVGSRIHTRSGGGGNYVWAYGSVVDVVG